MRLRQGDPVTIIGTGGTWIYEGPATGVGPGTWVTIRPTLKITCGLSSFARLNYGKLTIRRCDIAAADTSQEERLL